MQAGMPVQARSRNVGARAPSWGCRCCPGLFGLSLMEEKLLGLFLGKSGPYQAVPAAFPRSSLKQPEGHLLPLGTGVCASRSRAGVGFGPPSPVNVTAHRGGWIFIIIIFLNLDASRAAGLAGQRDAFPLAEINR